jgi:hypothetical protein
VKSVQPGETRTLKFHTSWGRDFLDSDEDAVAAKRCQHYGYDPARPVCDYLMENGSIEFAGQNVKSVLTCLSPKTRFASGTTLGRLVMSWRYGTEDRGSLLDLEYVEDEELGGMVLSLSVRGY